MEFMKYSKILQLGDPLIKDIFEGDWIIEEKIDGSNFRFGIDKEGNRYFGSKEVNYTDEHPPDKMFQPAIDTANKLLDKMGQVPVSTIFVCEYMRSPKHNTLCYERVPKHNLMLLDVLQNGEYTPYKKAVGDSLDMETVPQIANGTKPLHMKDLDALLQMPSVLGKEKVEGVVIKNFGKRFIAHSKSYPYMAKYVREEFKEQNKVEWGQGVPLPEKILSGFPKEPRWHKAVEHLRDRGELQSNMRDMVKLTQEVEMDFETECEAEVKRVLYGHYRHELVSGMKRGLAEWYKKELAKKAME